MAKLIKNKDGTISFTLDITNPDEAKKKKNHERIKEIKESLKDKDFSKMTRDEKDGILELLLRMHDLI